MVMVVKPQLHSVKRSLGRTSDDTTRQILYLCNEQEEPGAAHLCYGLAILVPPLIDIPELIAIA